MEEEIKKEITQLLQRNQQDLERLQQSLERMKRNRDVVRDLYMASQDFNRILEKIGAGANMPDQLQEKAAEKIESLSGHATSMDKIVTCYEQQVQELEEKEDLLLQLGMQIEKIDKQQS